MTFFAIAGFTDIIGVFLEDSIDSRVGLGDTYLPEAKTKITAVHVHLFGTKVTQCSAERQRLLVRECLRRLVGGVRCAGSDGCATVVANMSMEPVVAHCRSVFWRDAVNVGEDQLSF